ncbi:uncharacterized protein LOC117293700 [Asterias rubens]|uniref:uncharacterized protein LOC117293700 n=1 Tax=Asterias rubens TaxID=7604 RepID=UPI001455779D|nr:uncharacterized protein LOC117293700 [Asterias rubens]
MADRVPEWVNIAKSRALQKLHVKAYWLSGSVNVNATAELKTRPQGIRYLSFAAPLHLNYAKLHSGLIEAFGISLCKLQLFWKDVEGDFVSFSSDTELSEAIAMGMRKDVLHLYFQKIN